MTSLSMQEVRMRAPSVFAEHPWDGVSDRYTFIPTIDVVDSLVREGWHVTRATQQTTRVPGKRDFTRHLLRFRRDGAVAVNDIFPEIVLLNSHDTGSAYQMHAGLFRLVCSNGLVVADGTFARLSIRHSGNVLDEVRAGAEQIAADTPRMVESVEEMRAIPLSEDERTAFARSALMLKYDEDTPVRPSDILRARRQSDRDGNLWSTFNVVQENLTKGGIRYLQPRHREGDRTVPTRIRSTRGITSIDKDTKLNKALWTLAEEMKKLKA